MTLAKRVFFPLVQTSKHTLLGICLLATATLSSVAIVTGPAMAQDPVLRVLTVTGAGGESIPTTLTDVSLGVEVQGRTAEEVQREVARRSSAVVDFLKTRNVDKLKTQGISLSPQYNYNGDQPQLVGYIGSNTVSFRIPTDRIGNLLDAAVQAGATRIDGVSFVATDDAIADAQNVALQEATQDARQQANVVLASLGLSPQEIIGIQINNASTPTPMPVPYARLQEADAVSPVIGGEQTVQATVTLQIRY